VDGIYVTHGGKIAKNDLIRSDTDDRSIDIKEFLNALALAKANDVNKKEDIRYRVMPRTGYRRKRRQEEIINNPDNEDGSGESGDNKGEIMR